MFCSIHSYGVRSNHRQEIHMRSTYLSLTSCVGWVWSPTLPHEVVIHAPSIIEKDELCLKLLTQRQDAQDEGCSSVIHVERIVWVTNRISCPSLSFSEPRCGTAHRIVAWAALSVRGAKIVVQPLCVV